MRRLHFAALLVIALGAAVAFALSHRHEGLPVYYDAPAFSLTDQDGAPFDGAQLRGSAWVANFIYTNCPDVCPLMTANLVALRDSLRAAGALKGLRFVSFSVDPERDTPPVLAAFARRYHIQGGPAEWAFLTGPAARLRSLLLDGFHVGVSAGGAPADSAHAEAPTLITHSSQVLLIDGRGRVRGIYAGTDPADLHRLARELGRVRH